MRGMGVLLIATLLWGCATTSYPPPTTADGEQATITEVDRKACEEYSKKQQQKSVAGLTALGVLLVPVGVALGGIGAMGGHPEGIMIPLLAFEKAADNAKENRATREAALKSCLEPFRLQQTLGPEHPDVAWGLSALADGYVSIGEQAKAQPLYQRALAILENAVGEEHELVAETRVAVTLEHYAVLLREMGRDAEAADMEVRATTIRARPRLPANQEVPSVIPPSEWRENGGSL